MNSKRAKLLRKTAAYRAHAEKVENEDDIRRGYQRLKYIWTRLSTPTKQRIAQNG